MCALFTAEDRERTTSKVVAELTKVSGVERVYPFGSTAQGTADRHSDVDIAVVVEETAEVSAVAAKCTQLLLSALPVFHYFEQDLGVAEVRGFLLDSFLEIDLGVGPPGAVEAATKVQPVDVRGKLDFVWHDVIHAAAAIDRGRPWRALWYVERLRSGALELACNRLELDPRHFAGVDDLPGQSLAAAFLGIAPSLSDEDLWSALRGATDAFFSEAANENPEVTVKLRHKLTEYLDEIEAV